jgi:pilus assembly protein CpaF
MEDHKPQGNTPPAGSVGALVRQATMAEAEASNNLPFAVILRATQDQALRTLSPAELDNPGVEQREALRQIAMNEVRRYAAAAAGMGRPSLDEPEDQVVSRIVDEIAGLGSLDALLADENVEDVYILGHDVVHLVCADGRKRQVESTFQDREQLMAIIRRALARDGKSVDTTRPFADAKLSDGSRINVALHPCADPWPQVVIRKHRDLFKPGEDRLARMIELGTITPQAALFLRLAIQAKASILVTGATAAGKTTILNALANEFDPLAAVVAIEDTRELKFPGKNVSYLTTRLASVEGAGEIGQHYLVQQALRKRPDWIVLGEARGQEAWACAQAGNTGHAIMGSVHANGARDAIERYRDLSLQAGTNLQETVVIRGVVRAFRLVVYVEMDPVVNRRVVKCIADVTGNLTEDNVPVLVNLFEWDEAELRITNNRPYPRTRALLDRLGGYEQVMRGEGIPPSWLEAGRRWSPQMTGGTA